MTSLPPSLSNIEKPSRMHPGVTFHQNIRVPHDLAKLTRKINHHHIQGWRNVPVDSGAFRRVELCSRITSFFFFFSFHCSTFSGSVGPSCPLASLGPHPQSLQRVAPYPSAQPYLKPPDMYGALFLPSLYQDLRGTKMQTHRTTPQCLIERMLLLL